MGEPVTIPVVFTSGEGGGVEQVTSEIEKLGEAGRKAGEATAAGMEQAGGTTSGLSSALTEAEAAAIELNAAASQPEIEKAALRAATAVSVLSAEYEKAKAAGQDVDASAVPAMKKLGEASAGAAEKMKKLATESAANMSSLEIAVRRAKAATDQLGDAKSMRDLSRGSREATIAMVDLRAEIEAATESGQKVDDEAVKALGNVENAALTAKTKLAVVGDEMGDMGTKATIAAKGMESLAGSAGSVEALMGKLKDTGGPLQQKIVDLGYAAMGLSSAFGMGYSQGEKLRKMLDEWKGTEFLNYSKQVADLVVKLEALSQQHAEQKESAGIWTMIKGAATEAAKAVGLVKEEEEKYSAALDQKLTKARAHNDVIEQQRKALDEAFKALQVLNPEIKRGEDAYASATKAGDAWTSFLEKAAKIGEDLRPFYKENAEQLRELHQRYIDGRVPVEKWSEALKKAFGELGLQTSAIGVLDAQIKAMDPTLAGFKADEAIDRVSKSLWSLRDASDTTGSSMGGLGVNSIVPLKKEFSGLGLVIEDNIQKFIQLGIAAQNAGLEKMRDFREKVLDLMPAQQAAAVASGIYAESVQKQVAALNEGTGALVAQRQEMVAARDAAHASELQTKAQALAQESWGGSVDDVAGKVVNLNKAAGQNIAQMTVGAPMYFTIAKATKEQADALAELIGRQGEWLEKQTEILDKAPGWTDYLVALKSGYDSGMTSLNVYLGSLTQFETQIRQLFSGGGAGAQKAISEISAMIEAMRKAAMMSEPVANGINALDQLAAYANRMFGDMAQSVDIISTSTSDWFRKIDEARAKSAADWKAERERLAEEAKLEQESAVEKVAAGIVSANEVTKLWDASITDVRFKLAGLDEEWAAFNRPDDDSVVDKKVGRWIIKVGELVNGVRTLKKEWREFTEEELGDEEGQGSGGRGSLTPEDVINVINHRKPPGGGFRG